MIEKMPFGKRAWYPHMKPGDVEVWNRFIDRSPDAYKEVAYDVAVGEGAPIEEGTEENIAKGYTILTQRKIDVIGFDGDQVHVIEVKPIATPKAVGQIEWYLELFKNEPDGNKNAIGVLISHIADRDVAAFAEKKGIRLIILGQS